MNTLTHRLKYLSCLKIKFVFTPPYGLKLAPNDFLFLTTKNILRGKRFLQSMHKKSYFGVTSIEVLRKYVKMYEKVYFFSWRIFWNNSNFDQRYLFSYYCTRLWVLQMVWCYCVIILNTQQVQKYVKEERSTKNITLRSSFKYFYLGKINVIFVYREEILKS